MEAATFRCPAAAPVLDWLHGQNESDSLMSPRTAGCLVWFVSLARVVGGAVLLRVLGAPAWAVAAWLMLHVRVRIGRPVLGTTSRELRSGR